MGFNHTLVGPTLDGFRVGALTQQQSYGSKDDALARARFAGNY